MSELEPVLKSAAEDLAESGEKAGKAAVDHIGGIGGELKNAAGRYRDVDSEAEQRSQSVLDELAGGGEKTPKLGGGSGSGGGKIDSILGGEGGGSADRFAESGGKMRPEQSQSVSDALQRLKLQPKDQQKILDGLGSNKSPMGADAADLIGKGHLEGGDGYADVLSQFKTASSRPAAMMSLRHADDLKGMGQQDVLFEMKEQPGQQHFDIDVGTRGSDGSLTSGYQLKDVSSASALKSASRKAASQLQHAPTDLKVALMDVHAPSSEMTDDLKNAVSGQAERNGVTFHLRFNDGQDMTFPPGAQVYPGQ